MRDPPSLLVLRRRVPPDPARAALALTKTSCCSCGGSGRVGSRVKGAGASPNASEATVERIAPAKRISASDPTRPVAAPSIDAQREDGQPRHPAPHATPDSGAGLPPNPPRRPAPPRNATPGGARLRRVPPGSPSPGCRRVRRPPQPRACVCCPCYVCFGVNEAAAAPACARSCRDPYRRRPRSPQPYITPPAFRPHPPCL